MALGDTIQGMDKQYNSADHEAKIYDAWEKSGAFNPDSHLTKTPTGKTFTIVMPPPNANDPLHIGHAMFVALEDIMIRFHRMQGDEALWIPGTDHAGIETQFVFEKKLKKEDKSRFNFDRETLYQMLWDYVQQNSNTAVDQLKKIGASADWSRFTFTLDPKVVSIVLDTFKELHKKELVYRDYRLVNYCTKCGTAYSDLEIKHVEQVDPLYYLKYGPFTIATVRPETKFRDTALAANPNDPRYKEWIGKEIVVNGLLGPITLKVVADEGVDPEFGTGIMKVTPAHDAHDFELGKKYNLPVTPIIDFNGKMDFRWFIEDPEFKNKPQKYQDRAIKYHGKKVMEARKLMVEDMKEDGILIKTDEKYVHNIAVCYKSETVIEPLPMPQFFIKVKPLTEPVLKKLAAGEINVQGAGHDKILKHWLENLKDWNISRQIVWGIRMPIWYDTAKHPDVEVTFLNDKKERISGKIGDLLQEYKLDFIAQNLQQLSAPITAGYEVGVTSPGKTFIQETDTFDTWFSSAQWPFVTLQSKSEADFKRFYPTQVMETGYDILPFWVMRMLMMGLFKTGELPFSTIYMHGLVRDQNGKKMSKSKGNVVNPLTIIDKFGADALRMALVIRSTAGLDKSVGEGDFKAMRNLTNKVWNAARFVQMLESEEFEHPTAAIPDDTAFFARLNRIVTETTQQLNDYKLGLAAETVYNEFWHWFCDEAIEQAKLGKISKKALHTGLETFLKLFHPFIPFVTEAIWQELHVSDEPNLITASWPTAVDR